mmetsp:Transcript_3760/g.8710  ORF Transcript_3760/g.8710 Transcript_3760/m.8710 type:complete len:394 (+) Transcript_3760:151-1332(+)
MVRGAKAVEGASKQGVLGAENKQQAAQQADQVFRDLKKQASDDARQKEIAEKKERERQELARLRDERRKEFLSKQREAEQERRRQAAKAGGGRVKNLPSPEPAARTPEPTGFQIFTKVEVGKRADGMAAERRKAFQDQQMEAERNRRRALQDVGAPVQGGVEEDGSKRSEVLAQREREKEQKRLQEEAALEKIRRENFEARKAAAAAPAPPVIKVDTSPLAVTPAVDKSFDAMVYTKEGASGGGASDEEDAGNAYDDEEMEGERGEEEAEDEDFGAMLKEMTALIVHEEDVPGQVVTAAKPDAADEWVGEMGNTESSHERIEELRVHLEKELGFDRFFASYQYVKQNQESDEDVDLMTAKITELMGEEGAKLFPQLMQLISCEERTYGGKGGA